MHRLSPVNLNTREYWDARFQRDDYFDWPTEDLAEKIAALIPHGAHVLDVGCAMAWIPRQIKALRPDVTFTGCDFSEWGLTAVSTKYPGACSEVFLWDVREPPMTWLFKSYDVVLCTELIEHLEDPAAAIYNLTLIARRRLIVTTPNEDGIQCQEHVWAYSQDDLEALLSIHGAPSVQIARSGTSLIGAVDLS